MADGRSQYSRSQYNGAFGSNEEPTAIAAAGVSPLTRSNQPSNSPRDPTLSNAVPSTPQSQPNSQPNLQPNAQPNASDGNKLEKIRDILFGQQVQTQEQRFDKLEQRFRQDYSRLKADFSQRLDTLENRIMDRLDQLTERLREEEDSRVEAVTRLGQRLSQDIGDEARSRDHQTTALGAHMSQINQNLRAELKINQDLRAELKHETLALKDSLEQQIEGILAHLEKETVERKRGAQAERARLSSLLSVLSQQLSSDGSDTEKRGVSDNTNRS